MFVAKLNLLQNEILQQVYPDKSEGSHQKSNASLLC